MKIKAWNRFLFIAVLSSIVCCLQSPDALAKASNKKAGMEIGRYAEIVCLRMIAISQTILNFEKQVLEKLEAKRNVDKNKFQARLISARLQFRKLLLLSKTLDKKMSSSDPARVRVQSLRKRLLYFVSAHRKNIELIKAKLDLSNLDKLSEQIAEEIEKDRKPGEFEKITFSNLDLAF